MLRLDSDPSVIEAAIPGAESVAAEWSRPIAEQQLQMLTRLAEAGLAIAAAVERRAAAPSPGDVEDAAFCANLSLAYSRVARAVRMTIALQSRLLKELVAFDDAGAREREARVVEAARARATADRDRATARVNRVGNVVDRVLKAELDNEDTVERLSEDAWERLQDEDVYGDLSDRPIGEIVALICKDLGLSPDWSRWAHEAWAVAEAQADSPGSPFVDRERCATPSPAEVRPPTGFDPQAASP